MPSIHPLVFYVTGKGGTGKSFIASTLARTAAGRGLDVALVRLRDRGPGGGEHRETDGLREITLNEDEALEDFLTHAVRLGFVAERLLASRTFSAVAAAAPGLRDLVTLSAICDVAESGAGKAFDLIFVDAPASGHSAALVTAPARVLAITSAGPMGRLARRMDSLVKDPARCRALIVTSAEDLAVTEALDLQRRLRAAGTALAPIVVNGLYPARLSKEQAEWLERSRFSTDALLHLERRGRQCELIKELEFETGPTLTFPFLFEEEHAREAADGLLDELTGGGA